MSYANLKKNLNHIGSNLQSTVLKESEKIKKIERKIDIKSSTNKIQYDKYISMQNVHLNSEENMWRLPTWKCNSDKTLFVFVHNMFSPFLGEKIDRFSKKLSYLKRILLIDNTEDFEKARSSDCFSPWEKMIPPRVASEDFYRPLGQYLHIKERSKAHIGFLTVMAQATTPIEANTIMQSR